jgi:hypothetical protein
MPPPKGKRETTALQLGFDRRLKLGFHDTKVTSNAGMLPYRKLDGAIRLTEIAGDALTDTRRGGGGTIVTVLPGRFASPFSDSLTGTTT